MVISAQTWQNYAQKIMSEGVDSNLVENVTTF
jgi:hypothetical protein